MTEAEAKEIYEKTDFLTKFSSYPEEYADEKAERRRAGGYLEGLAQGRKEAETLVEGLNDIASWGEGAIVNGSFDDPPSATKARETLAQYKKNQEKDKE